MAETAQTPEVIVNKKPNTILHYCITAVAVVSMVLGAIYIMKYRQTKTTLDTTKTNYTKLDKKYKSLQTQFASYQTKVEANTSWTKEEYYESGKLKNKVVYNKNTNSTASGAVSNSSSVTASEGVTTIAIDTKHETKQTQSGVPINGLVYISVPYDTLASLKFTSLGLGISHSIILDFWVGSEFSINNIDKNPDPLKDLRFNFQIGHGIP